MYWCFPDERDPGQISLSSPLGLDQRAGSSDSLSLAGLDILTLWGFQIRGLWRSLWSRRSLLTPPVQILGWGNLRRMALGQYSITEQRDAQRVESLALPSLPKEMLFFAVERDSLFLFQTSPNNTGMHKNMHTLCFSLLPWGTKHQACSTVSLSGNNCLPTVRIRG